MMKVCRVCLSMSVKMYHILEHKLIFMYERVTGVEINTEDKLPKMLCWECVARLSTANNFKEKALKTQRILINEINNGKLLTMSDIESIDRAQYQLESTLGFKYYKENDTNCRVIKQSDDIIDNYNKHCDAIKSEPNDININNKGEQIFITEVSITTEDDPIKREYLDAPEQLNVIDEDYKEIYISDDKGEIRLQNTDFHIETQEINIKLNPMDEDVAQDSYKQHVDSAQSTQDEKNMLFKNEIRFMETPIINMDTNSAVNYAKYENVYDFGNSSQTFSVGTANSNSNIILHDNSKQTKVDSYSCDYCSYKSHFKRNLIAHINAKHIKNMVFNCDYCSYKSYFKNHLSEHVNTKHTKSVSYYCAHCDYVTHVKRNLIGHINAKHTQNNVFNCTYCNYKTYRKQCLNAHINTRHTKTDVFNCSHCTFKTYRKTYLRLHVNAKHTKKISYNCSQCSYKAFEKCSLNRHVNAKHTKSVSYNCSHCTYKAYDKCILTAHVNAKHTNKVYFNCSFCIYQSFDKRALNAHLNAKHTRTNVYNCSHCAYQTYYQSCLTRHVKTKHS